MKTWQGVRIASVGALLLLAGACARGGEGAGDGGPAESTDGGPGGHPNGVALRVEHVGGLLAPAARAVRLPVVTLYADGRVITEGAQTQQYPGPALPNLQEQRIATDEVDRLVDRARTAGVAAGGDLGRPSIADVPSTRFTVSSAAGTEVLEVYALSESTQQTAGLTEAQRTARTELRELLAVLTDLAGTLGPDKVGAAEPYRPVALAAVATPWQAESGGLGAQPEIAWPGPALPGPALAAGLAVGCVEVRGAEATGVLAAAGKANSLTPWTSGGKRWNVGLRPLLPEEAGCADLSTE